MDISSHLLIGFRLLPKITATVNGVDVDAVFNQSTHRDNKTLGGYEADNEAVIAIETSLLTNPFALKGKYCIIDSVTWRIVLIKYGSTITHLTIVSTDKP